MSKLEPSKLTYIAELGSNWRISESTTTNYNYLMDLIKRLAANGVDYVKLQAWDTPKFVHPDHPGYDQYRKYQLPNRWYRPIIELCKSLNQPLMMSVFDEATADQLHALGLTNWKIASGDLVHYPLIRHIAAYNQPMTISTGNANTDEIKQAIDVIRTNGNTRPLTVLHCISKYPTPINELGLARLTWLVQDSAGDPQWGPKYQVGFSSHVRPEDQLPAITAARTLGANVIELHVRGTSDGNSVTTPDYPHSITPDQLCELQSKLNQLACAAEQPIVDEHELLWARRAPDGLRPWIRPTTVFTKEVNQNVQSNYVRSIWN